MAHQLGVYLLILLPSMIAHLCWCARYNNYLDYSLEGSKFCDGLSRVHTHEMRNATAVIIESRHMFDRWDVNYNRHCKFTFKTAKGEGLFAVIHNMYFRRNGSNCLDYVRFKRSDGFQTERFCGLVDLNAPYPIREISNLLPTPRFASEFEPGHQSGKLETEIFISKEGLSKGDSLNLRIIYTPYKQCSTGDNQFYVVGFNSCIRKEYICDGIHNCIEAICNDEENCPPGADVNPREDTTTEVTVGAVTTVILCFIIFVMCLWICKRSQKLCWSSDCAGPNVCSRPSSLPPDADGPGNHAVPSAPMLEVVVSSPVADKDLPPSYDSLFPEQSNPARS